MGGRERDGGGGREGERENVSDAVFVARQVQRMRLRVFSVSGVVV